MVRLRRSWVGLAAILASVALVGAGWLMTRSRPHSPGPLHKPMPMDRSRALGTGSARLSWSPVDTAANSAVGIVDPIAGFRIYVGPSPDALQFEALIDDPTATQFLVEQLPKGTFFFSVTTYTKGGIESPRPTPVSKIVR